MTAPPRVAIQNHIFCPALNLPAGTSRFFFERYPPAIMNHLISSQVGSIGMSQMKNIGTTDTANSTVAISWMYRAVRTGSPPPRYWP